MYFNFTLTSIQLTNQYFPLNFKFEQYSTFFLNWTFLKLSQTNMYINLLVTKNKKIAYVK